MATDMNTNCMATYSPAELVLARSQAFSCGDFGFLYDSYHSESNFRQQFVEREEYLRYGQASLGQDYHILNCQVLSAYADDHEPQVIFLMEMKVCGAVQQYAELAWLRRENLAWRYHRGQKITTETLLENPQSLNLADFARLDPATIF